MHKYMTWSEGKYFESNKLLESWQIERLLDVFKHRRQDTFVTIQDYDARGEVIGCPLYFDIDAESLMDAYGEAQDLVMMIEELYSVEPIVWFSGGKGFHVIAPLYIRHPRCHEIVDMIREQQFDSVECDLKVYRTRSMFRCENTWNIKGERYKVWVPQFPEAQLVDIIESAKDVVAPAWRDDWRISDLDIEEYVDKLPEYKPASFEGNHDFADMMPCLRNLWSEQVPPEGARHELALLMVRHCHRSGLEREQAQALFAAHPFWSGVDERDYLKIIRTIYNNGRSLIGCKHNKLLQANCIKFCKYNTGMTFKDTFKQEDK
jgi:hypothetical protein